VRSSGGETDGAVSLGMSSTLAAALGGAFFETCKAALPKVTLKLAVVDSESIKVRIEAHTLDLGMVFEDELVQVFSRKPLFRQRLYLVGRDPPPGKAISVSFDKLATLDLILPSLPNVVRS
jgi:LysR family nitrogen assimilation transcriptional regulator